MKPMFPEITNDEVDYAIEQCVKWEAVAVHDMGEILLAR